jgi:integrase
MAKLSATGVKNALPAEKSYKLADGGGLYLLVTTAGGKYWRYDYRFARARKTLALGAYPDTSLKNAREQHAGARQMLADTLDPSAQKKLQKLHADIDAGNTFTAVADEWRAMHLAEKSDSYRLRSERILFNDLYPAIGFRPVKEISSVEVLAALRKIEDRTVDIAHRARQLTGLIFRYAIATGRADRDPTVDLKGALKSRKVNHHAAITDPRGVGMLLRDMEGYEGRPVVKAALELSVLLFQRPGEIRQMKWEEINWLENRWEIPAEKMKMARDHIVPLSRQAITALKRIEPITGRFPYVFPNERSRTRPMSDNGIRTALRTLGYSNEDMTPHGFRAMARTLLDEELRIRPDWIEQQLAHRVSDPLGRAYNRTAFIKERTNMMQVWADYLDDLRDGGETRGQNVSVLMRSS